MNHFINDNSRVFFAITTRVKKPSKSYTNPLMILQQYKLLILDDAEMFLS